MTSSGKNINTEPVIYGNKEPTPQPGRKIGRTILVIVLIAAAAYFAKPYLEGKPQAAQSATPPKQPAPSVVLHLLETANLAAGREYIGKVESIQTVLLKPQISGQIAEVHFREGSAVKAGQVLFTLDARQFQATVDLRKADLAKADANYDRAVKYHDRLKAADKRSVSASDLDAAQSDVLQSKAGVEQAKAALKLAQIDLDYTKITAPISGQIGKAQFTKGNYVTPASGALASIVQVNPVRVAFALPDKDYLDMLAEFQASDNSVLNAALRLSNGEKYTLSGTRDFEENTMDERTGTIAIRFRFKNDSGFLVPGSMVRVLTSPVRKHTAVVMPQVAILSDGEGDYAYVVDERNVAHQRRIELGIEAGTMREVVSGLQAGEKVVLYGLQSLHPEITVAPIQAKNGMASKSPAELAMESASDVQTLPAAAASDDNSLPGVQKQPAERKN